MTNVSEKSLQFGEGFKIYFDDRYDDFGNFSVEQIRELSRLIKSNREDISDKKSVLRFRKGTDFSNVFSFDDLLSLSYHCIREGKVLKEGTFRLHDTQNILSRESLILLTREKGKDWVYLELKPVIEEFLFQYVKYWGWFYPESCDKDIARVLSKLAETSNKFSMSTQGSDWLKTRVKSFWDVDGGPSKKFWHLSTLGNVLSYRLGLNNSKPYEYVLSTGEKVVTNETFDINFKTIRTGFLVQRNKVSWFKPSWAAFVYGKYTSHLKYPVVWDPSIGFSARMLGFAAVHKEGKYIGTDPSTHMFSDACSVSSEINRARPNISYQLINTGSEKYVPEPDSLDLVFTSPPYFDAEKYYDEEGQCWRDYPSLDLWRRGYFVPTMKNARRGLKEGGKMVINISSSLRDMTIECAREVGFRLVEETGFDLSKDHFARNSKTPVLKQETFLVFE